MLYEVITLDVSDRIDITPASDHVLDTGEFYDTSSDVFVALPRITSYNVCYTKLLRHRIVFHQAPPGVFIGPFFCVIEPSLNILAGRTGVITGRQPIDVDRFHRAPASGVVGQAAVRIECDGEGLAAHNNAITPPVHKWRCLRRRSIG